MTLAARGIAVNYGGRVAVRRSDFALDTGSFVALVGPNGAGKSSLLKALCGLLPHDGTVTWRGAPLGASQRAVTLAYLPQSPPVHWPLRARDLVALGRLPHRAYGAPATAADATAVAHALAQTDVATFAERAVDELSVGERARVLLARALAVQAPVLLVDEPVATLDPHHQLRVMHTLRAYAGAGRLVVAVLHDLGMAARFATRVLLMNAGAIVADAPPREALSADNIRTHYRVEPFVTELEGHPVIVPWRAVQD